jgi:hypothetical protein
MSGIIVHNYDYVYVDVNVNVDVNGVSGPYAIC